MWSQWIWLPRRTILATRKNKLFKMEDQDIFLKIPLKTSIAYGTRYSPRHHLCHGWTEQGGGCVFTVLFYKSSQYIRVQHSLGCTQTPVLKIGVPSIRHLWNILSDLKTDVHAVYMTVYMRCKPLYMPMYSCFVTTMILTDLSPDNNRRPMDLTDLQRSPSGFKVEIIFATWMNLQQKLQCEHSLTLL